MMMMATSTINIGGRKKREQYLFLIIFLCICTIFFQRFSLSVEAASNSGSLKYTRHNYKQVSSLRLQRIEKHLNKINKPAVITVQVFAYIYSINS